MGAMIRGSVWAVQAIIAAKTTTTALATRRIARPWREQKHQGFCVCLYSVSGVVDSFVGRGGDGFFVDSVVWWIDSFVDSVV